MITDVLNKIGDVEPTTYKKLVTEFRFSDLSDRNLSKEIRKRFNITRALTSSKSYWTSRGWSAVEAAVKSNVETKKRKETGDMRTSVFTREFWLKKTNPTTGKYYTNDEADFERFSKMPTHKEYWIKQGDSLDDAIELANVAKYLGSLDCQNIVAAKDPLLKKVNNPRSISYYTSRGLDVEEAKSIIADKQSTFSLDSCIAKYGEEEGVAIWEKRQSQWISSISSSQQNKTRSAPSSIAENWLLQRLTENFPSIECQFPLYYKDEDHRDRHYTYDIKLGNHIIEYHGDFWHCNPSIYNESFFNPKIKKTAKQIWDKDSNKLKVANENGYTTLVIWESEYKIDKDDVVNRCVEFLENANITI